MALTLEQQQQVSNIHTQAGQMITAQGLTNTNPINISNIQAGVPQSILDSFSNIQSTAASLQKLFEQYKTEQANTGKTSSAGTTSAGTEYDASLEQARTQQLQLLQGAPKLDIQGLNTSLNQQYGVDTQYQQLQGLVPQIGVLNQQLAALEGQKNEEIAKLGFQDITQGFSMGMQGRIERYYAAKMSAPAAQLAGLTAMGEMLRGNIGVAQGLIQNAITAATYEITQQREDFDNLYNYYGDVINSLETKQQTALANAREDLKTQEANQREDYTNLLNLMMTNPQAGISLTDTVEQAAAKVAANPKADLSTSYMTINGNVVQITTDNTTGNIISQKTLGSAGTGINLNELLSISEASTLGVPYGTTRQEAINMGIIPKSGTTNEKAEVAQHVFDQLKQSLDNLGLANNWFTALSKGASLSSGATTKANPEATAYKSLTEGSLSLMIRGLGESGVLNDQDIRRARQLVPTFYDTKKSAELKFEQLQALINAALQKTGELTTTTNQSTITQSDGTVWQQNADGSYTRIK